MRGVLVLAMVGLALSLTAQAENVRVRIKRTSQPIVVSGLGATIAQEVVRARPAATGQMRRYEIKSVIRASGHGQALWLVRDLDRGEMRKIPADKLSISGLTLRLGVQPAPGELELTRDGSQVDVVAAMDMESYLLGVLPSEMPAGWPLEALKAQAVASRSYALSLLRSRREHTFHLEASILDQVFNLENHQGAPRALRDRIEQAVRETQGEVLYDSRGRVLRAHYHSDCGGQTEAAENIWGEEGRLAEGGTVRDGLCPLSPLAKWEITLPKSQLESILRPYFSLAERHQLLGIALGDLTPSGRVSSLRVSFSGTDPGKISAQDFRRLVGFNRVRSTFFKLAWQGANLTLVGRGHGHGVGLCQYGSRQLAQRGLDYRQILKNYYPKASLGTTQSVPSI